MAGGVLKGFGITFLSLGILLMVLGLAAAAYGAFLIQENDERLIGDGDQQDEAEAALLAGAATFAVGLVLLILGLILNGAGNGRRHRELLAAAQAYAKPLPPPATTPGRNKTALAMVLALLAILVFVIAGSGLLGDAGAARGTDNSARHAPLVFDGAVRQAFSMPLAGAFTADTTGSQQGFAMPAGATQAALLLEWTPVDGGTPQLRFIVEANLDGTWTELGRIGGLGPLLLQVDLPDRPSELRYSVFPHADGSAVVEQPFQVRIEFPASGSAN